MLGLGVTPTEILLQAVGSADDPSSGGPPDAEPLGQQAAATSSRSRARPGSQCIPAVGCAEAGRYIVRRPQLGLAAEGDELTYVSLGEGACSEGEFWESLNTACNLHLPVLYVVPDNGFAISVPTTDQHPAPVAELVRGFRGLEIHRLDGTDYFAVRKKARSIIEHVRAGVGPALIHADVVRPYSHSAADTQSKYRSASELAEEATRDPIDRIEHELVERRRARRADEAADRAGRGQGDRGQGGGRGAGRPPARPGPHHRAGRACCPRLPEPPADLRGRRARSRSARPSSARCTR